MNQSAFQPPVPPSLLQRPVRRRALLRAAGGLATISLIGAAWKIGDKTLTGKTFGSANRNPIIAGQTPVLDDVYGLAYSPNGRLLATGTLSGTMQLWQYDGRSLRSLAANMGAIVDIAFSPDGALIAAAFAPKSQVFPTGSGDPVARIWRVSDGTLVNTFMGHTGDVLGVAFSPDGLMLASASADETVRLWDVRGGMQQQVFSGHDDGARSVAFSPDGQTFAVSTHAPPIRLWSVRTGGTVRTYAGVTDKNDAGIPTLYDYGYNVTFSPDGQTIAAALNDDSVRLWQTNTGTLMRSFTGLRSDASPGVSFAFAPNGQTLATAADRGDVRLWRISDGTALQTVNRSSTGYPVQRLIFSPDGHTLAIAIGHDVQRSAV